MSCMETPAQPNPGYYLREVLDSNWPRFRLGYWAEERMFHASNSKDKFELGGQCQSTKRQLPTRKKNLLNDSVPRILAGKTHMK